MSTTGKPERDGESGGERPKPEIKEELFNCSGGDCLVKDRATEMFNTSCDPARITLDELKKKVLCMNCAIRYARRRGKDVSPRRTAAEDDGLPRTSKLDITTSGSGLYPLVQTLRAMRSLATATTATRDDEVYPCMERGCTASGRSREMFNRPCDMASTGMRELLALVCCRQCAETIAAKRNLRPGESESGVYLFEATLRRIRARTGTSAHGSSPRERHEQSYLQWYLRRSISRYAEQLMNRPAYDDGGEFTPPIPRLTTSGSHRCGLPIGCCDHEGPAERFLMVSGKMIGLCALAAQVFSETAEGLNHDDPRRHRIFPAESPERAVLTAMHSVGPLGDERVPDCPACANPKARH